MNKMILPTVFSLLFAVGLSSCGGGASSSSTNGGDNTTPTGTATYTGPGSFVTTDFKDGEYTISYAESRATKSSPNWNVTGTYEEIDGFLRLKVGETQVLKGDYEGPAVGEEAWGVEIPGLALFLDIGGQELIPLLSYGACPTKDFRANWLFVQGPSADVAFEPDATDPNRDWFGSFEYQENYTDPQTNLVRNLARLPGKYALSDGFPEVDNGREGQDDSADLGPFTCSDSLLAFTPNDEGDADQVNMWLTGGGAIVEVRENQGSGRQHSIIAVEAPADEISSTDIAGDYAGYVVQPDGNTLFKVHATIGADGNGDAKVYGSTTEDGVRLSLKKATDKPNGWFVGKIGERDLEFNGTNGSNIACAANTAAGSDGKRILFCISQSVDEGKNRPFSIILTSR